jgi:hypothetical protein
VVVCDDHLTHQLVKPILNLRGFAYGETTTDHTPTIASGNNPDDPDAPSPPNGAYKHDGDKIDNDLNVPTHNKNRKRNKSRRSRSYVNNKD